MGLALQLDFIHSSILSSIHPFNSFHLIWPKILIFPFPNFRFLIFYPVRETKKWNEKKRNNKVCHWMMQRNCNCTYKWMNNNNNKIRYTFHHFFFVVLFLHISITSVCVCIQSDFHGIFSPLFISHIVKNSD